MRIEVVTVPYRYDELEDGLGAGPGALVKAGLLDRLTQAGLDIGQPQAALLDDADRADDRTAVNIGRLGARTAALVAAGRQRGEGVLTLAGDDTAAVGVVAGVQRIQGASAPIGVVWFDAHGDFNTPETSYSGILAGMPVAILAGLAGPLWREAAGLSAPIPTDRILLAGLRDLDEKEAELLRSTAVRMLSADDMRHPKTLGEAVRRLAERCACLCLHVDLDLLDPRFVPSASTPSAGGLSIADAAAAMRAVLDTGKVATVCLTSLNPGAGERGQRSLASALDLLVAALPAWRATPNPE
jgi:arginase